MERPAAVEQRGDYRGVRERHHGAHDSDGEQRAEREAHTPHHKRLDEVRAHEVEARLERVDGAQLGAVDVEAPHPRAEHEPAVVPMKGRIDSTTARASTRSPITSDDPRWSKPLSESPMATVSPRAMRSAMAV